MLKFQPAAEDFGQVSVGQSRTQTFTVTDTGGRASSALTVSRSGSTAFAVTSDTCTLVVSDQKEPLDVAVADGQLYWTDVDDGSTNTVPVTGGTPTMLFGFEFSGPVGIAVGL